MESQNTVVSWIALIIAVLAVVLAWVAFNRTGTDFEAVVRDQIDQRAAEMQANYDQLEAEVRAGTANQLNNAATDVRTDENATTTTGN
jgi:hypothetical protein